SSLNLCTTDGDQLVALRFRNQPIEHPPTLYYFTRARLNLNWRYPGHPDGPTAEPRSSVKVTDKVKEHGAHVIVASQSKTFDEKDWRLMDNNPAISVDEDMKGTLERLHEKAETVEV
ncbi:hypothetical protein CALCODRAFT_527592, partial [Calocera cornea HHB12733]